MFALNVSKFLYIFSNWFEILPISTWQSYLTSMLIKFQNVLYNTDGISMKILLLYVFKYYRESLYMLYIHIYIYDICVCVPLSTKIDRSIFRIVYVNPPSAHFIFTLFLPKYFLILVSFICTRFRPTCSQAKNEDSYRKKSQMKNT